MTAAAMAAAAATTALVGGARLAHADDTALGSATIVYARGAALYRADGRGKGEAELAPLPAKVAVRALRTDANATVLIADLGGRWSWMPLDGSAKALAELPCGDGPAQLAVDGACVLCRSAKHPDQSVIVNLRSGKQTPVPVPAPGARLVGAGAERRLIWADAGIWSAPPGRPAQKTKVAPEAPLRGLLPSPDGSRAVGVFLEPPLPGSPGATKAKPAELLMGFALDGQGARRKGIRAGVPVEWSQDNQWVLIQDGSAACLMRAIGGQYKCWRGYTAAAIAPDGSYALVFGSADAKKPAAKDGKDSKADKAKADKAKADKAKADKAKADKAKAAKPAAPVGDGEGEGGNEDEGDEDPDGPGASAPVDDVAVPPPSGPLSLYRAKLDGPYTEAPVLVVKLVDGAAVWLPPQQAQ